MKFDFDKILGAEIDPNNRNRIVGQFPDDTKVSVERHLDGWEVNLKIVVGDTVWHDTRIEPDEKPQFNKLRERAFDRTATIRENQIANNRKTAGKWLLGQTA